MLNGRSFSLAGCSYISTPYKTERVRAACLTGDLGVSLNAPFDAIMLQWCCLPLSHNNCLSMFIAHAVYYSLISLQVQLLCSRCCSASAHPLGPLPVKADDSKFAHIRRFKLDFATQAYCRVLIATTDPQSLPISLVLGTTGSCRQYEEPSRHDPARDIDSH